MDENTTEVKEKVEEKVEVVRHLATIQKVTALDPIPNADKIECASVLGWKVVVKKGEFNVGDLCVYFEVDSILKKDTWNEFLVDKNRPDKPIRLKTVKLRGQVSQGLAMPLSIIDNDKYCAYMEAKIKLGITKAVHSVDDDVGEFFGVTQYTPDIPAELKGLMKGNFPGFLIKTDVHRVQAYPGTIEELQGVEVYVTTKIDGTSFTAYSKTENIAEGHIFGVCSRNIELKDTEGNTYWNMTKKYGIIDILKGTNSALQSEIYGNGVQGNKLGMKDVQIAAFDVFSILGHRYLDYADFVSFCDTHNIPRVPVIYVGVFKWKTVDELVEFADAQNYANGTPAEGVVIRPVKEMTSYALRGGRLSIKAISRRFQLTYGKE